MMQESYEIESSSPIGKHEKVIGLKKDELDGKIMTEFAGLRPKTYPYFTDFYSSEIKETKLKKERKKERCNKSKT